MVEVRFAAKIVHLVIFEGRTYLDAIDEIFPDERKIFQSSNLSVALAKEAIRHFYLYENIINELKIDLNSKQKSLVYVALSDIFYTKLLNTNNLISFLQGEIPADEFKKLLPLLKRKEPLEEMISFGKDTNFYYATKYNVPIWLAHMWRKHFGDELTKDFLESSLKHNLQHYVANTFKSSTERLLLKCPDFSSPFEDSLIYKGNKRYQLTPEFKNDEYIDVKMGFKNIIDNLYNPFDEVLLYSGYDDDFVKTEIIKTNGKQGLNVVVPSLNKRAELMRFIRVNDIHNVNLFEANDIYAMKAGVSYKVDTVIVFPKSTRFDIISKYPDFLLHFDRDDIDEILAGEKKALELCYDYVNEDGTLVYIVNTFNKKESKLIIEEFLANHPDFVLDREEQLIPTHPFETTMYYAFMHRKATKND